MTVEEAKDIYMSCFGNEGRYMWHEIGSAAYKEYCDLNITREIKSQWDTEIIESYMEALQKDSSRASSYFIHVLQALIRGNCEVKEYAEKLLDLMENMTELDELNKISIIRYMGEDSQFDISGCQFYCVSTPFKDRMDKIMRRLMDFECPDEKADPRFEKSPGKLKLYYEAVEKYEKAYEKWSEMYE
ncbi:MAG: hypothetical protein IJM14_08625 [Lachnospiraceae bacterium]|nr:hypothetical protein [Lachnospiraceae bacterium]